MTSRRLVSLLATWLTVSFLLVMSPLVVQAAEPKPCKGLGVTVPRNSDTEIPVILVHGFRGSKDDWGTRRDLDSVYGAVHNIDGVNVVHSFQYNSWQWVDASGSGPRLAKVIDCYAYTSNQRGGPGRVILIGYSMGGLVIRDAISRTSSDGLREIQSLVAQVITIGTPHEGVVSSAGRLLPKTQAANFAPGSQELEHLSSVPSGIPSYAIAGNVIRVYQDSRRVEVKREHPYDDTLVGVLSATAEYNDLPGGGKKIISCEKRYREQRWGSQKFYRSTNTPSCEHGELIRNTSSGVRSEVVGAIQAYLAWRNNPGD